MRWSTRLGFPRVWFSPSIAYALTTGQGLLPYLLRSSGLLRSPPASALLEASLSALGRPAAPLRRRMPGSILPPSSRRIAGRNMFRATRSQRGIVYHSPVPARSGRLARGFIGGGSFFVEKRTATNNAQIKSARPGTGDWVPATRPRCGGGSGSRRNGRKHRVRGCSGLKHWGR